MQPTQSSFYIANAFKILVREKILLSLFVVSSFVISVFYLFLLPSLPDGTFSSYAINFITPVQITFSFVFGICFALIIVLNILAFKNKTSTSKKLSIGAVFATLVNGLCCTPVIPSVIALTGASTPLLFEYSPPIEAFFENYAVYFYVLSALLMFVSIHYISKRISCCCTASNDRSFMKRG